MTNTTNTTTYILMGGNRTRLYHLTTDPTAEGHIWREHGLLCGDMEPGSPALPSLCGKPITDAVVMDMADSNNPLRNVCKNCAARI